MDNALAAGISPLQMVFLVVLQVWFYIVFPILVLRKLNYLTQLMQNQFEENEEDVLQNDEQ